MPLTAPGLPLEEGRGARLEAARVLDRYRRLLLLGRLRLPLEAGRRLVGPDCAYHLYARGQPNCNDRFVNAPSIPKPVT